MLNISDTSDDTKLDDFGAQADRVVDNSIYAFVPTLPLTGADITDDVILASNLYTCYLYRISMPEIARNFHAGFQEAIGRLKTRYAATPTSRTKIYSYNPSYVSSPMSDE